MRYFNSLPNLITTDNNNNLLALKNLLVRTSLLTKLQENPLLFYKYDLQEGDTPEIVANKYYGDSYRYWMVLYGNPNIIDPQFDWPLSTNQFQSYMIQKYSAAAGGANNAISYTQGTVHSYQKIVTTTDSDTQTTAVKTIDVDANTYNSLQTFSTTQTFPNGSQVTYTVSKHALSIYDYENQQNEAKRSINLIKSSYANDMETQYTALVSA